MAFLVLSCSGDCKLVAKRVPIATPVGLGVWGREFRVSGSRFQVPGSRFRVSGSGFSLSGFGARV